MLMLTEAILHLRKSCPTFQERVAGTQSFAAATNTDSDIDVPACFIVPMSDTAAEPVGGGTSQLVTERFATIVVADNSKDPRHGRGLTAEVVLRQARSELIKALVGWSPLSMAFMQDVRYARSQHLFMNNARIWHQYEWTCGYYISGDQEAQDSYQAIEKIINGYFPEVDARKVRLLASNGSDTKKPMVVGDPSTYEVLFSSLVDTDPSWVRYTPHAADPGLENKDPGDMLYSGHRDLGNKP